MARGKWATTGRGGAGLPITDLHYPPSGGGSIPDWVPDNAKIHIDFLGGTPQGRAWSNGAQAMINTLLGADANTDNGFGPTEYDPTAFATEGYAYQNNPPALIGAARTLVIAGATVRIQVKRQPAAGNPKLRFVLVSTNGNDAVQIDAVKTIPYDVHAYSYNGPFDQIIQNIWSDATGAANAVALTVTSSRLDIASNGSTAVAGTLGATDRPVANPLVAVVVDGDFDQALQSITIYDPLSDTTGLSELSNVN